MHSNLSLWICGCEHRDMTHPLSSCFERTFRIFPEIRTLILLGFLIKCFLLKLFCNGFYPLELFPLALLLSCTCLQQQDAQTGRWDKFGEIAPHPGHRMHVLQKRVRIKKKAFFQPAVGPKFIELRVMKLLMFRFFYNISNQN